jgi:hypothetical protein
MSVDSSKINGVAGVAAGAKDTQPVSLASQRIAKSWTRQWISHRGIPSLDPLYRGARPVALFIRAAYPLALLWSAVVRTHGA